MEDLFGKYCYIDTPWIAGAKTRYRILGGGCESNTWCEPPVTGKTTPVCHDSWEKVVFVVLDTLVSDDSIIRRFALKDIEVIEEDSEPETFILPRKGCHRPIGSLCDGVCNDCPYWYGDWYGDTQKKNADKFREVFGIYATELWAMPEAKFLEWLNAKGSEK